ncbi:nitrogen regulation protein NR(I) [Pollutimonas harenae]|uniref:DNA-binding transcriptional regulator NtrC n=1 Tax=Pollutimonas harenae TaxID=657015 RepID=A0A853GS75_9BURK|nr:nitrogen regulation protein NR(I) [Pollutimonas harenae]NYT85958.1 nitrogen regulation protein NR(I) [Pollutimonas harenae]TEA71008.1 nitrogen regulation protein NR(I) [Pollutimonas harenae]
MKAVWIVDDDQSIRWVLEKALARVAIPARSFDSAGQVLAAFETETPSVLVTDVRMPGEDGLSLLHRIKQAQPGLPVIVMTAFTDLNSTVKAFQKGAFDYLPKPFDVNAAVGLIQRAARTDEKEAPAEHGTESIPRQTGRVMVQSASPAMQEVFRAIGRLAASSVTVLITGESGTGKELIARALHDHSNRAQGPFVALNAAAIPKDLLEAELFGHERGAFTGATQQRRGRFEEANNGTLFFDEIGDMPLELQTRLLRVLAEGSFYRVGGSQAIQANVRIVAATHQPLEQRVAEGSFREDLFHRLNVIRLRLPPLRERTEDIPALTQLFMRNSAEDLGVPARRLSVEAMHWLSSFNFPGNIRQLENLCQWLTVMSSGQVIEAKDLPPEVLEHVRNQGAKPIADTHDATPNISSQQTTQRSEADVALARVDLAAPAWTRELTQEAERRLMRNEPAIMATLLRDFERVLLETALAHSRGRRMEAAQRLGIGRNTLTRKCSELGLDN